MHIYIHSFTHSHANKPCKFTVPLSYIAAGKFAVGTLDKDKCTHFSLDITIASDVVQFSHTGDSDVHVTGYKTVGISSGMYEDVLYGRDDSEEEDSDYDGEEESSDYDEEDEEEDDDDDDEAPEGIPLKVLKTRELIVDGAEEDEEYESSEEEDEDEEDEEEEENGEEEVKEPEPVEDAPTTTTNKKRKPAQMETPVAVKKSKPTDGVVAAVAPATAPAKLNGDLVGATPHCPVNEDEYGETLKKILKSTGAVKMASLGTLVKRPPKSPKLKKFLEQNKEVFKYDPATDSVSLIE